MASDKKTITIDVPSGTSELLKELQASVRKEGRAFPSQGLMIAALIAQEKRRGLALDDGLLVPFRLSRPDVDAIP